MLKNIASLGLIFNLIVSCAGQSGNELSPADFKNKINSATIILDVRSPREFKSGHLANAINMDINSDQFESRSDQLDKTKTLMVYCLSGVRSHKAGQVLRKKGFVVQELKGGINAWQEEGMPVVK